MNLPFGLPLRDTGTRRREETVKPNTGYDRKLEEYRETLEKYKDCILAYSGKLENYERRTLDNQLSIVQTALDITYLKEQQDRSVEMLEEMKTDQMNKTLANLEHLITAVLDTNYKMDGLDKNVVNRLSELTIEMTKQVIEQNRQNHTELEQDMALINHKVKKNSALLWFLLTFNLISLAGLAFMILYIMNII